MKNKFIEKELKINYSQTNLICHREIFYNLRFQNENIIHSIKLDCKVLKIEDFRRKRSKCSATHRTKIYFD
jgi:hypothetical protein